MFSTPLPFIHCNKKIEVLEMHKRLPGGGGGHPDPDIKGGGGVTGLQKIFFPPFGPQFALNIRVGGPALDPPLLECPKSFHLFV